jgi:hypothetical protein
MDNLRDARIAKEYNLKREAKVREEIEKAKAAPPVETKKDKTEKPESKEENNSAGPKMIEVYVNDRVGRKVRVKCWYIS